MELVTLVVAFAAFGMSIFATWAALRQADAAESAVDKAAEANKTADEALRVAKAATEIEHDRRHAEMQPRFSMAATGGPTDVQAVTFTNGGPVQYDRIVMEAGEESSWAICGFLGTGENREELVQQVELPEGLVVGGTAEVMLARVTAEKGGIVPLRVTAYRRGHMWRASVPVELEGPSGGWLMAI